MSNRIDSDDGGAVPADGRKTRRDAWGVLASASALAPPRVGLVTASTDPVFAAIERHKAAWSAVGALCPAIHEVEVARRGRVVAQADWAA